MHQISFMNLAEALILFKFFCQSNLCIRTIFECKKCLTFDTGNLLNFAKLRTEPLAATPCVNNFCSFWRLYFERDPASSTFSFGIVVEH